MSFEEGGRLEAAHFETCRRSSQSRAIRHRFFAEREAGQVPGLLQHLSPRPIRKIGVVGAGTMVVTVLLEAKPEPLERGLGTIRSNYAASVTKGKLTQEEMQQRMGCLRGTLDDEELADCDLVIEAVFEDMTLKQQVMRRLGNICKPGTILATNTSTLNVDHIAGASAMPADVIGTHFFSPANVMRLLEVVRGARTAPDVLLTINGSCASHRQDGRGQWRLLRVHR